MKDLTLTCLAAFLMLSSVGVCSPAAQPKSQSGAGKLVLSHAEYLDRIQAVWMAQMIAQRTGGRFEHQPSSVLAFTPLAHLPGHAPVVRSSFLA
jgi:hypothetical protein